MSLKINEFIISASVNEEDSVADSSGSENASLEFSESIKQEIIDECLAKMKELLEREKSRY